MPTPKPRSPLRPVDRALVNAVMFEQGIVPMEDPRLDMRRALSQLPPDEARKLKRRFRKLWRKAMREAIRGCKNGTTLASATKQLGVGKRAPTRVQRNARKQLVFDSLWKQLIGPLVTSFENAGELEMLAMEGGA